MTTILKTSLIAPDSSHWAKWLDAMHAPDLDRRRRANALHAGLMESGRVPLLSWHHLEELMGIGNDVQARARVSSLQSLPLLGWFRMPGKTHGLGSIVQILAAEAIAASEGLNDLVSIRDRARVLILRTGEGRQAIGQEGWVWDALRPLLHGRRDKTDMIAALGPMKIFDDSKTIGELVATSRIASSESIRMRLAHIHDRTYEHALRAMGGDAIRARAMANSFMEQVPHTLPPGMTVRDLLLAALGSQGVDEDEIRDDCVLADLNRLGLFRSQLRAVASETGKSFQDLKQVNMDLLPSRIIGDALRTFGQPRDRRPGSDVHDGHLAVIAAYCDVLYVDKRTAEDFRQARRKEPRLNAIIGEIATGADFEALLGSPT